jgi:hypothetical protein
MSFDLKLIDGKLVIKNGDLDIVEDSDKLVQDVLKLVSTQIGSMPLLLGYGSPISQALIGTAYDAEFIESQATMQLRASLERLQTSQTEQLKSNQTVTPQEQIAAIKDIKVSQNLQDPRKFLVNLTVISKAFQSVPIYFELSP